MTEVRISRGAPLLFTAALLLACGDDDGAASSATLAATQRDDATATTADTTSTTVDPDAELKAEIEQAYYAQWDAFIEILSDPDPNDPLIDRHFIGAARERLLDVLSEFIRNGWIARRPDDPALFQPSIQRIDVREQRALVVECTRDGLLKVERSSGAVVDDAVLEAHFVNTFRLVDGDWKVESTSPAPSGEEPCDA